MAPKDRLDDREARFFAEDIPEDEDTDDTEDSEDEEMPEDMPPEDMPPEDEEDISFTSFLRRP